MYFVWLAEIAIFKFIMSPQCFYLPVLKQEFPLDNHRGRSRDPIRQESSQVTMRHVLSRHSKRSSRNEPRLSGKKTFKSL